MGPALSRRSFLFDQERANIAGNLIAQTRPVRLSLGDLACLALALASKAPVLHRRSFLEKSQTQSAGPYEPLETRSARVARVHRRILLNTCTYALTPSQKYETLLP